MYATHQTAISNYARECPDHLARVMRFVILSIREPLFNIPADMEIVGTQSEGIEKVLWGIKGKAIAAIDADKQYTYDYLEYVYRLHLSDIEKSELMLCYLATMPGFGLPKAGFVIQLAYGLCGCMDTHNLKRYGLGARTFQGWKTLRTAKYRFRRVQLYVKTCYELGGPEELWNSWCEYVAPRTSIKTGPVLTYRDAEHVSAMHCEALELEG